MLVAKGSCCAGNVGDGVGGLEVVEKKEGEDGKD